MLSALSAVAGKVASELEDQAALGHLDEAGRLLNQLTGLTEQLLVEVETLTVEDLQARLHASPG